MRIRKKALDYAGDVDSNEFCAFVDGAEWLLENATDWIGDKIATDKYGRPVSIKAFREAMGYDEYDD